MVHFGGYEDQLKKNYNHSTQVDAFSFFKSIDDFDFLCNLVITYKVLLKLTLLITELLQSKKNDLADGIHMITSLITKVKQTRSDVEKFHNGCFEEVLKIAKNVK